jgi:hypothetical protein
MPTKQQIKANKAEARAMLKTLKANDRAAAKIIRQQRTIIRRAEKAIALAQLRTSLYAKKIHRRLAILDGRNDA